MNLPNKLTVLRVILVPVFIFFLLTDIVPLSMLWALVVFSAASITDALDGHIARSRNLVTNFGKFMDPLADKLMSLSVMLSLTIKGVIPWPAPVLLLLKEGTMVVGGLILYSKKVVVFSEWIGKLAQAAVVCGLISCFFHEWLQNALGFPAHLVLLWAGVALTLCALCVYMRRAIGQYREAREKEKSEA